MARILLADDDAAARELVARALKADGHTVDATQDGTEALEHLGSQAFDLLVTDLHMPGMDGASLAKHVRARHPAMRILLMSGYTGELDKAAASLSGPVGTIPKPFTLESIRAAVKKVLA